LQNESYDDGVKSKKYSTYQKNVLTSSAINGDNVVLKLCFAMFVIQHSDNKVARPARENRMYKLSMKTHTSCIKIERIQPAGIADKESACLFRFE